MLLPSLFRKRLIKINFVQRLKLLERKEEVK